MIKEISPWNPITQIAPTVFVLVVAILREGYEDFLRYRNDQYQNEQPVEKITSTGDITYITSKEIQVGDVLLIKDCQELPCDLLLIESSDKGSTEKIQDIQAQCFIQTSSLDGEKNLKKRVAPKGLIVKPVTNGTYPCPAGEVICDVPNANLYEFMGQLLVRGGSEIDQHETFSLNQNQLLLKGSKLMNTDWIVGAVVYSGLDTKLMQNQNEGRYKQSNLEKETNMTVIKMLLFHCTMAGLIAWFTVRWNDENTFKHTYLELPGSKMGGYEIPAQSNAYNGVISFFSSISLNSTFIPIALLVAVELVKLTQAWFIEIDTEIMAIMDDGSIQPCKVNSSSLNEELGQVRYVFSDKTGTLTQNIMEFRMCMIGHKIYGDQNSIDDLQMSMSSLGKESVTHSVDNTMRSSTMSRRSFNPKQKTSYNYKNSDLEKLIFSPGTEKTITTITSINGNVSLELKTQKQLGQEFLKCLSSAHQCMVEKSKAKDGEVSYQGPSPDEVTLVEMAKNHGYEFVVGNDQLLQIQSKVSPDGSTWKDLDLLEMEVLRMIEFTSDRKRMSILVKDRQDGHYKLYCKGADNVIIDRLNMKTTNEKQLRDTKQFLYKSSLKGYRTLLVAMKILDEDEVTKYMQDFKDAEKSLETREERIAEVCDNLERDLTLIGSTVVEDRLQDKVPEVISALHQGHIKVWMLTGDKMETAESIGFSCALLTAEMDIIRCSSIEDLLLNFTEEQSRINQALNIQGKKRAIVIQASALQFILEDTTQTKRYFLKIARTMETVVCCRVSPSQKAAVVKMMKQDDPAIISLSIGDGANDVSMILEADIGIGLFGKEGNRAVDSSDYAIAEFRFLWHLIFKHGRWNYQRMGFMINYFFYKNFVYTLMQLIYQNFNGFSSISIFPDWFLTLYNLVFTALPICSYATWEKDIYAIPEVDGAYLQKYIPSLYFAGQRNITYNQIVQFTWLIVGLIQALILFFIPYFCYQTSIINADGVTCDIWICGMTVFTSLLIVVHNKMMIHQKYFDIMVWLSYGYFSYVSYFLWIFITDSWYDFVKQHFTFYLLWTAPQFYLIVFLSVMVCFIIDFLFETVGQLALTDPRDSLRRQALSGPETPSKEFEEEFDRLVSLQDHLELIEDSFREAKLDVGRSKKYKPAQPELPAMETGIDQKLSKKSSSVVFKIGEIVSQPSQHLTVDKEGEHNQSQWRNMARRYSSPLRKDGFEAHDLHELKQYQDRQLQKILNHRDSVDLEQNLSQQRREIEMKKKPSIVVENELGVGTRDDALVLERPDQDDVEMSRINIKDLEKPALTINVAAINQKQ